MSGRFKQIVRWMLPMRCGLRDFFLVLAVLPALIPLTALISALLVLSSGRPVFYSEKRVGFHGKEFTLYKFRTLDKSRPTHAKDQDGRIHKTRQPENCRRRFLRFLRRYSLDELPQVWNVLTGDMSMVGPRPMPAWELTYRFGSDAWKITSIRPGLSGLWQVSGRSDLSREERRGKDFEYLHSRNGRLDFKIILKTLPAVLSARGAY